MNKLLDKDARVFDKFSREITNNNEISEKDARAFDKFSREITNEAILEKSNNQQRNLKFNNHLEKHEKYLNLYKSNELFWGLGIENEFYLECEKRPVISKDFFLNNHKRERYSVNYYSNYDPNLKNEAFGHINANLVDIPFLINSHSFTDTDKNNNHKTLEKTKAIDEKERNIDKFRSINVKQKTNSKNLSNPNFNGKTLGEEILESTPNLQKTFNKTWLYDGDTFEITTLNFYKTDINQMVNELEQYKKDFIENIQKYQESTKLFEDFGKIKIMEKNYPFGIHLTNLNNIGIFNNGTLHYNLTLPTELDNKMLIKNPEKFKKEHKEAIKIIQWFEPFFVSVYGTPDYFSQLENYPNAKKFSASSQRCAVSRYIGLGTYNTDEMVTGKILLTDIANYPEYFWYNKYHETSAYNKLDKIGLDINFNKHYNHGIEIRFFDHISQPELIIESFEFIIYLIDLIFEKTDQIENPVFTRLWNNLVCAVMTEGKKYNMSRDELDCFEKIIGIKIQSINIYDVYYEIFTKLKSKFSIGFNNNMISVGKFSRHVLMPQNIILKYPNIENITSFRIANVLNLENFAQIIEKISNYPNIPNEIINIVEVVETFKEIEEQLFMITELTNNTNENSKLEKITKDINQIIKTSVDVLNYNISKILENKNTFETQQLIEIINLIECFKSS